MLESWSDLLQLTRKSEFYPQRWAVSIFDALIDAARQFHKTKKNFVGDHFKGCSQVVQQNDRNTDVISSVDAAHSVVVDDGVRSFCLMYRSTSQLAHWWVQSAQQARWFALQLILGSSETKPRFAYWPVSTQIVPVVRGFL